MQTETYPLALGVQHIGRSTANPSWSSIHALGQHQHVTRQRLPKPRLVQHEPVVAMTRDQLKAQPTVVCWRRA